MPPGPPLRPTGGGGGGGGWDDGPDDPRDGEGSRNWVLAIIAGALVLIALFLALNLTKDDAGDDQPERTTTTEVAPPPPASTPADESAPAQAPSTPQTTSPQESTDNGGANSASGGTTLGGNDDDAAPEDGGPVLDAGGVTKLEATQGDKVTFQVKSDTDEEVHVHGYDLKYDITAGETKTISFDASLTGIFEIELENSGTQIGELTVNP